MTRGEGALLQPVEKISFHKSCTASEVWLPHARLLHQQMLIGYHLAKSPIEFLITSAKILNYLCLNYMQLSALCLVH